LGMLSIGNAIYRWKRVRTRSNQLMNL